MSDNQPPSIAASKAKPSTQANPAPNQAANPASKAPSKANPAPNQARQTQHPGKASHKTMGKALPWC